MTVPRVNRNSRLPKLGWKCTEPISRHGELMDRLDWMPGLGHLYGLPDRSHHGASDALDVLIHPDRARSETPNLATKFQVQFGLAHSDNT